MTKPQLKPILVDLENTCYRLALMVIDRPELTNALATEFQQALDFAQQRLDDARETPEARIAKAVCPRCGMTGRLLWHYDAGTCVEEHGEPGWATAKRLARDADEPTDF